MDDEYKHIQIGDRSLAYIERGQGAPVVLVHGSGPTDLRTWGQQIDPFSRHFRVIAYSQRGHFPNARCDGGSEINSSYIHAGDLAALITHLGLAPIHLVGFSYGADIALRFSVEYPGLVRTLAVTEPALFSWLAALPGGAELYAGHARAMLPAKQAALDGDQELSLRLFIDAFMGAGTYARLPASLHVRLRDNAHLLSSEQTDIQEIRTDITPGEAAAIRQPALILTGDESASMFLLVSQELARCLPHAEKAQIAQASHLLHVMNPQAYNAAVLAFLARHAQ